MSRKVQSQWEFGELFPTAPARQAITVSELTSRIRRLLENQMGEVWVTGEVTNLRAQSSGHIYFTLKDAGAQLSCVLFRSQVVPHREYLQDGQKLLIEGALTVYEPRGQYQLVVHAVELQGLGALQLAFERLKRSLEAEGLFAPERKRPLPPYAQRLGLVTSPTGAAIRDVLHVIARRQPGLEIILAPCRVQGEGAATEIAAAIRLLNQWSQSQPPARRLDIILVTRGGGSLEDLWAFNEEQVARAIFHSALPVVSAVGHEIDFTISDFVADLRAATPSAAAELITEGMFASRQFLADTRRRLHHLTRNRLEASQEEVRYLVLRLGRLHPRRRVQEHLQRLDDLQLSLVRRVRAAWQLRQGVWTNLQKRLARATPATVLGQRRRLLQELTRRLRERLQFSMDRKRNRLDQSRARLPLLGPGNVLARGYSITLDDATGQILRAAEQTRPGQRLRTQLASGEVRSVVESSDAAARASEGPTGPAQANASEA